jgi:hypothetical protein
VKVVGKDDTETSEKKYRLDSLYSPKHFFLKSFFFFSNLNQKTFARFDRSRTVSVVWAPTSSKDVIAGTFNWVCPFLGS